MPFCFFLPNFAQMSFDEEYTHTHTTKDPGGECVLFLGEVKVLLVWSKQDEEEEEDEERSDTSYILYICPALNRRRSRIWRLLGSSIVFYITYIYSFGFGSLFFVFLFSSCFSLTFWGIGWAGMYNNYTIKDARKISFYTFTLPTTYNLTYMICGVVALSHRLSIHD
jgi:hypothetical protein